MNEIIEIRFAPRQKLPPGYRVEWWECDERYHWTLPAADLEGGACCCRWMCWRGAWTHYYSQA